MATTKITYNGAQISSVDETAPVAVTYNGSTLVSIAAGESKTLNCNGKYMATNVLVGSKTLNCANKLMASNVVVEVEQSFVPPTKGQIITMTLGNATPAAGTQDTYRVLSIEGTIAFVVAMFDQSTSTAFNSNSENIYFGGELDTYLNTTWYNSLNATAKSAIQATNITQYQYVYDTAVYNLNTHSSYADYSTKAAIESAYRYVYTLDVEDIETYFNSNFKPAVIWTMLWGKSSKPSTPTYPCLRSTRTSKSGYVWYVDGTYGYMRTYLTTWGFAARPAFRIDLSQISWS